MLRRFLIASVCCLSVWPTIGVAQDAPLAEATKTWLDANTVKVATLDVNAPYDDLMPLGDKLRNVRVLILGEESHGDGACFAAKARLVRFLHEQMGFNVLAFESGFFESDQANDLLQQGVPLDSAIASFQQPVWCMDEVKKAIDYVARSQKTGQPMWLAGFDNQTRGTASSLRVPSLLDFLDGVVPISDADRAALLKFGTLPFVMYKPDQDGCREILPALTRLRVSFDQLRQRLEQRQGVPMTDFYSQALDNLRALERQTRSWATDVKHYEAGYPIRDPQMADNIRWLAENGYPNEKIICWCHTGHALRNPEMIQGWLWGQPTMGTLVKAHFGDAAYELGFCAHHGKYRGMGRHVNEIHDVKPTPGSLEDTFHRYGNPLLFVDLRQTGPLSTTLPCGCMFYMPLRADWTKVLDGVFFTDEMTPSTPMQQGRSND